MQLSISGTERFNKEGVTWFWTVKMLIAVCQTVVSVSIE